jgi:transglutaminase-like putative cysteine protease
MRIRAGFNIAYDCPAPCPMILMLSLRPERFPDLVTPQIITADPAVPLHEYRDSFGNICHRLLAPAGRITFSSDFIIEDSGTPDPSVLEAVQHPVEDLPDDVLVYLLPSRFCETDLLSPMAWQRFGSIPPGGARAQAIVDYAHQRIAFDYQKARVTRSAFEGHDEGFGVCRDYAHLAVTLCRCMNIPARYCTGYLGDIGIPPVPGPMDFSAWFEVYLGGRWWTMDARHNKPRIGRLMMALGRDAADVAITTHFGVANLLTFEVISDELANA